MEWLTNWITREGPGIPRDAPKKTGLPLFFATIWREAWELFKLNIILLLLAVPIITIPASFAAACRICVMMIEDEVVDLWRDYWRAFVRYFFPATNYGLLFGLLLAICGYALFIYGQMVEHSLIYVLPTMVAVFVTLLILMVAVCLFTLMVKRDLPRGALFRLALIAAFAHPLFLLAGLGVTAALWLSHILFYPASIFLPVVMNFSLGAMAMVFGAHKTTDFALGLLDEGSSDGKMEDPASLPDAFLTEETT